MPFEGSGDVDDGGLPSQTINDDSTQDESPEVAEVATKEEETPTEEAAEYTEKGTKLDPNPQSRAHQELANERRQRLQYQQVLENPEALKKYAAQMGLTLTEAKAEIKQEQKTLYTPDRFKTADDVANALNEMHTNHESELAAIREENQRLKEGLTGFSQTQRIERIATTMAQEVSSVREKYPELNPKSPEYDKDLEKEIGEMYHELDFDEKSGGYKGNYSIAKLTDRVMRAAGKARQKGSQDAQTQVKVKQAGKVVTSSGGANKPASESKDPGTVIAQRIAKALGN